MAKIVDRLLLLLYSLVILVAGGYLLIVAFAWVPEDLSLQAVERLYHDMNTMVPVTSVTVIIMLISLRFLYVALRSGRGGTPSIDQRTEYGDIRISIETVENLALRAAGRVKGVKDLRARVRISHTGIDLTIRAIVDGDTPIPVVTEDIQRLVKDQIEEITGIPVSDVSVFVANIANSSPTFRSRVE